MSSILFDNVKLMWQHTRDFINFVVCYINLMDDVAPHHIVLIILKNDVPFYIGLKLYIMILIVM